MKPGVLMGIAFLVGLGGSTMIGMKRAPAAPVADTTAAAKPPVVKPPVDSTAAPVDTSVHPDAISADTPHDTVAAARPDSLALAQTFAKLDPKEVALLGSHMSDADFAAALRTMGVSRSAAVLAELPKARAATISKLLLAPVTK